MSNAEKLLRLSRGGPPIQPAVTWDPFQLMDRLDEEALQREKVPVIYHEAVRNYFRRLAQMDAP